MAKKKKEKIYRPILDYRHLFETSSPKDFLRNIFFSYNFTRHNSIRYKLDFKSRMNRIIQVFNYFDEDDLYIYFKINHDLHKNKSKYDYLNSLYVLVSELMSQTPKDDFFELDFDLISDPSYIFHFYSELDPKIINFARDFLLYGYDYKEVRVLHSLQFQDYRDSIEETYQKELLPIDMSQRSYY